MFNSKDILAQFEIDALHAGSYCSEQGWGPVSHRKAFDAINPADDTVIAQVATATADDYEKIIACATDAQRQWRMVPAPRRGELVARIGDLIAQNIEALATVVALDTGKSLMEARGELRECVDMSVMAAGQSRMLYGFTQQSQREKHRMYDQWLPLGVAGIISAYNFPAAVWAQNGFLAAIGGNTVVWKPSPKVPLTAIAIQTLCNQAMDEMGYAGVFSLFMPEDNAIAELMLRDPRVPFISFTGSSGVGRKVANIVGSQLGRRYMLECSGNNGCIIDETADLELAARSITFGAVGTTGQRCTSTRRVIVKREASEQLVSLLKQAFSQIRIGDPSESDTVVGPLVDRAAIDDYEKAIAQAVEAGGKVVYGGKRIDRPGYFVEPALITGVSPHAVCVQHETFAPIVYILEYDDLLEAIEIHNGVAQGLASGIHSSNLHNIELFLSAAGSDCGIAKVNMGTTGADIGGAFGGEKETGGGRTAGSDAWKGYMRRQSVCINWGGGSPWDQRITFE